MPASRLPLPTNRLALALREDPTGVKSTGAFDEPCIETPDFVWDAEMRATLRAALTDADVSLIARLIANGAGGRLETLWLACEEVGATALGDLAEAIADGALPSLRHLYVSRSAYGHLKEAVKGRAMLSLSYLKQGTQPAAGSRPRSPPRSGEGARPARSGEERAGEAVRERGEAIEGELCGGGDPPSGRPAGAE